MHSHSLTTQELVAAIISAANRCRGAVQALSSQFEASSEAQAAFVRLNAELESQFCTLRHMVCAMPPLLRIGNSVATKTEQDRLAALPAIARRNQQLMRGGHGFFSLTYSEALAAVENDCMMRILELTARFAQDNQALAA